MSQHFGDKFTVHCSASDQTMFLRSLWFRAVNTPPPCLVAHVSSNVLCGDDPAALGVNQAPSTLARPPNRHSCTLPTKINPSSPMPSAFAHVVFPPTQPTARDPPSATRRLQQSLPRSQKRGSKQEMWKMLQFHHDVEYHNTPGVFTSTHRRSWRVLLSPN